MRVVFKLAPGASNSDPVHPTIHGALSCLYVSHEAQISGHVSEDRRSETFYPGTTGDRVLQRSTRGLVLMQCLDRL